MKVFVPLTDEMLEYPDRSETLVPYQAGLPLRPIVIDQQGWIPAVTDLAEKLPADPRLPDPVRQRDRH